MERARMAYAGRQTECVDSAKRTWACRTEAWREGEWHMRMSKLKVGRMQLDDGHVYNLPLFVISRWSAALVLSEVTLHSFTFLSESFYAASLNWNEQRKCHIRVRVKEKYDTHKDSLVRGSFKLIVFHFKVSINLFQVQHPPMRCSD
jgi:hypothetical protein